MIDKIIIIEDVIPFEQQNEIEEILLKGLFPWYFRDSLSSGTTLEGTQYPTPPGFAHVFYNEHGPVTNFYEYAKKIVDNAVGSLGRSVKEIIYGRTFLQLPLTTHSGLTNPHVDVTDREHLVCLYYVTDSDGETVFFDKKHTPNLILQQDELSNLKINHAIVPKKGVAVLFDGMRYHANILPKTGKRCIINFDVVI